MTEKTEVLIEPQTLAAILDAPDLLLLDLCKAETYAQNHVPGAVHIEYSSLLGGQAPSPGKLPPTEQLSQVFSAIGLTPDKYVVAYDDEGSGKSARLFWTLHAIGHVQSSVLNGGLIAWANEGHPLSCEAVTPEPSDYTAHIDVSARASKEYILGKLHDDATQLLDARTPQEYQGTNVRALRGGHIPGAINLNWLDTIDRDNNARLKVDTDLQTMLEQRGFAKDKEVITYCQTHHRSAHSYMMLKHLGFDKVRGYDGSWSEWGNDPSTPIA